MSGASGPDTLYFLVNGVSYSGWNSSRVTRGVERFPSDFEIAATETFPALSTALGGSPNEVICKPGDACQILLGADPVLTGFVDRLTFSITPESHTIRISGRGKCQDLADCSAVVTKATASGSSAYQVAQELIAPFTKSTGITALSLSGDGLGAYFSLYVALGETVYEILEKIARYEGLLLYEDANGNLVFSIIGKTTHYSGIGEGRNVQAASSTFTMDERFSVYIMAYTSADSIITPGTGANTIVPLYDESVPRYRPRIIISDQDQASVPFATARGNWEIARRRGRSQALTVTLDSWRDAKGVLWQPNYLIPIQMPSCKVVDQVWCISEVSYLRDGQSGTTAQLIVMPQEAFTPEPPAIQTTNFAIARDIREGATQNNTQRGGPS